MKECYYYLLLNLLLNIKINFSEKRTLGDVIVSADLCGSIKIFVNALRLQAEGSNFFPIY